MLQMPIYPLGEDLLYKPYCGTTVTSRSTRELIANEQDRVKVPFLGLDIVVGHKAEINC